MRSAHWVEGPVTVQVPATSANLGPGFDALGLALALHDTVTADWCEGPPGAVHLEVSGEGARSVPRDATHLVHRALRAGLTLLGAAGPTGRPPALRLTCVNAVPHGRGLGSSSAAIVAGLMVARGLVPDGLPRWDDRALLAEAARLEGHPDNVAPALLGGLTVAWAEAGGAQAVRLPVDPALSTVVLLPPEPLSTVVARSLLPAEVPHADAARNAGRAALLVAVLTGQAGPEHLLTATEDRLHQAQRAPVMPESARLVERLRALGVPAVVSGAGPSILALTGPGLPEVRHAAGALPAGWRLVPLAVDTFGARLG